MVTAEKSRTVHDEALALSRVLGTVRRELHDLRGEPAALWEPTIGADTSLAQLLLDCRWLAEEIQRQVVEVHGQIDRLA